MRILLAVHQFLPTYAAGTEIVTYKVAKGPSSPRPHRRSRRRRSQHPRPARILALTNDTRSNPSPSSGFPSRQRTPRRTGKRDARREYSTNTYATFFSTAESLQTRHRPLLPSFPPHHTDARMRRTQLHLLHHHRFLADLAGFTSPTTPLPRSLADCRNCLRRSRSIAHRRRFSRYFKLQPRFAGTLMDGA